MTERERFWSKVQASSAQACWIWMASKGDGYGQFGVKRHGRFRMKGAHIISYEYMFGSVPAGKELHHTCKTRACVNWLHLEPITKSIHAFISSKNTFKTHCPKGHPYTEANTWRNFKGHRYCKKCHKIISEAKRKMNMSFRETVSQMRLKTKTVTRRKSKTNWLNPNRALYARKTGCHRKPS